MRFPADAGAPAALEGERLHNFHAIAPAEAEGAGVTRRSHRIAPQKQPLGARPDPVEHAPLAVFAQQVAIAVAEKTAGAGAELHQARTVASRFRAFDLANVGLVIRHAEVFRPILGRNLDGQTRGHGGIYHGLVHALGVHIDLDLATAGGHAVEHRLPELVAAFLHTTLAVDPEGDAAHRRAGLQQCAHRIAAVGPVRVRGEALDGVVGMRAIDPLVAVHPEAELELHAASHRLLADEAEHLEVAIALGIGQLRYPHTVAGNIEQERVGKEKVGVRDAAEKVVADAETQVEAVEALGGQHGEVVRPHFTVVVPGLVFDVAGEETGDASDRIGGAFRNGRGEGERAGGVGSVPDAIRQFEEGIDQSTRVLSDGEHDVATGHFCGTERQALVHGRRKSPLVAGGDDAEVVGCLRDTVDDAPLDATGSERAGQFSGSPATGRRRCHRVSGIEDDGGGTRGGTCGPGSRGGA